MSLYLKFWTRTLSFNHRQSSRLGDLYHNLRHRSDLRLCLGLDIFNSKNNNFWSILPNAYLICHHVCVFPDGNLNFSYIKIHPIRIDRKKLCRNSRALEIFLKISQENLSKFFPYLMAIRILRKSRAIFAANIF